MNRTRVLSVAAALALTPVLVLVGGVAFQDGQPEAGAGITTPTVVSLGETSSGKGLADTIAGLQDRAREAPDDAGNWSALGLAYLAQARSTADPSYYVKADEVFGRSLAIRPEGNADALAGQAALANARHEFASGRELAERAVASNPYSSTAKGVLSDSLFELGDYDAALTTLQEMVDLKPGVPSYTRVSDSFDLRGNGKGAQFALEQALRVANSPNDASYSLFYLGELAFNSGDHEQAADYYGQSLRRDPAHVPSIAGQAKAAAASGDTETALRLYADVVQRLPQPTYLVEYGEFLDSLGRGPEAEAQYAVAAATSRLFDAAGVVPDIEIALFHADHGRPDAALTVAQAQYDTRRSVHVEDALAWALHVNGRDEEALRHAEAAQKLGTRNALWDYHRGMIELELGLDDRARASLQQALSTNSEFSTLHADRAREALATLGTSE